MLIYTTKKKKQEGGTCNGGTHKVNTNSVKVKFDLNRAQIMSVLMLMNIHKKKNTRVFLPFSRYYTIRKKIYIYER